MNRRRYLALLGTSALAGCTGSGDEPTPSSTGEQSVVAETVVEGLRVPWGADFLDGELYLTERRGRIVRVADGTVREVADLTDSTAARGEGGLLGLAFAPDGETAYTYQTYADGGEQNRILRHDLADDWTTEVLFDGIPGAFIHDGGRLLVHDGALYASCGDAAEAESAQERDALSGKILRLTLDGEPHPENPFANAVFTWGHRNPQGFAVRDGEIYVSEHGPDVHDEINLLKKGNNYGWPEARGPSENPAFTDPLISWSPTIAPGGAAFYPDDGPIADWRGDLFVGTLKGSHLRRITIEDGEATTDQRLYTDRWGRLRTTFVGPDRHLYAVTSNRDGRGRARDGDDRVLRFTPG
ncbi:PQQ-dependent sugar dehydrogenase [Natronomonas sp. EA1]|uniref:PQQ-dependent sugar dehydrogenase n=1 Tax=Natronomonas sp. EA1 TaxID=3421655 RepID=UPI003EBBD02C